MARGLALLALAVALAAVVTTVRGDDRRRYELVIANAGQLVPGGEVQLAGVRVGAIDAIGLTADHRAVVTIRVEERFGPLRRGTTAAIRATSLSGVANRTVALQLPPGAAPALADGARLPVTAVEGIVDLDQLVAMFDGPTRAALRSVITGAARASAGREATERVARFLAPALSQASATLTELGHDGNDLDGALRGAADTSRGIAREADAVERLVLSTGTLLAVGGRRSAELGRTARALPAAVSSGRRALTALRGALPAFRRLVATSDAHRRDIEQTAARTAALLQAVRPAAADTARAVDRPGVADLLAAVRGLPQLSREARPAAGQLRSVLPELLPVLAELRLYSPDLVGALGGVSRVSGYHDANGHFARVSPAFNAFRLAEAEAGPGVLVPREQPDPLDGVELGRLARCPGGAAAPPDDGSAPDRGDPPLDCAPRERPAR